MTKKEEKERRRRTNELARIFYRRNGYVVPEGYKFNDATHPQEILMWDMACIAYDFWIEELSAYDLIPD